MSNELAKAARQETLAALRAKALAAHRQDKLDEAKELYRRYLATEPGDALVWSNLGALLRKEGAHILARAAQRRAYELSPELEAIRANLANILADLGDAGEALELRQTVSADRPDHAETKAMIGKSLRSLGRYDDAVAYLGKAWADHPDYPELGIQLAMSQLAAGDYAAGFRNFDVRWQTNELTPRNMTKPKWDGSLLDGKRILVMPEQGYGDGIAFARFLPALQRFNPAKVMMLTEKPVARLFDGVAGADWVGPQMPEPDDYDVWTNIMDLPPLHFDVEPAVPAPTVLSVPEDSQARARAVTRPFEDRFRVGVVWTGSLTYRGNRYRSFSHTEFHSLVDLPALQLFSLYKGPETKLLYADGTANLIMDVGSLDRDFADCAAMMQRMDLVITSDTATAHLAGSLGVPVWVLLHWDPFWMWGHEGVTTPWYPSMHLIRQNAPRDWANVFVRVRSKLAELIERWGGMNAT